VREHRSLGPSRRAAGVEEPGRVVRRPLDQTRRSRRGQPFPLRRGGQHRSLHPVERADQQLDVVRVVLVGDDDRGPAVTEDVGDLVAVQPGVDGDGNQAGVPDRVQRLEVLGPVAHHDRDPVPGREAETVVQPGGGGGAGGELPPGRVHPLAVSERRFVPQSLAIALNPCSQVHRATSVRLRSSARMLPRGHWRRNPARATVPACRIRST